MAGRTREFASRSSAEEIMAISAAHRWLDAFEGRDRVELDDFQDGARRFLIRRAASSNPEQPFSATFTYQEFRDRYDPHGLRWSGWRCKGIAHDLGCISVYEHQHGRPLPSAAVVYAGFQHPARDFWTALCADLLHMEVPSGDRLAEFVTFWTEVAAALS
jgi:hypothetical protein